MSFKGDLVRWLGLLQWTAQGQVTFVDFEATSQRTLPVVPASKLCVQVLSLHQRAQVLRMAMIVLNKHAVSRRLTIPPPPCPNNAVSNEQCAW